jgi:hypothetical protein
VTCGQGNAEIPFAQFSIMEASVPVGNIHDGHVQLFLTDLIHQILRRAFHHPEADAVVPEDTGHDLLGGGFVQRTGNHAKADDHRGAEAAVPERLGRLV